MKLIIFCQPLVDVMLEPVVSGYGLMDYVAHGLQHMGYELWSEGLGNLWDLAVRVFIHKR